MSDAAPAPPARARSVLPTVMMVWFVGPGSFGAAMVFFWFRPDLADDPPCLPAACGLVVSHLAAGLAWIGMLFLESRCRRLLEFWLLLVYGLLVATFVLGPLDGQPWPRWFHWTVWHCIQGLIVLVPIVAAVRWWRRR